ncbi:MAG: hypothetical protein IKG15_07010 [Solobacterium sp.]|nr:hypothetical protein [Solobacterium sp.]
MKDHYIRLRLNLHREKDVDIIRHLERQENKTGYIKGLIRKDIGASDE